MVSLKAKCTNKKWEDAEQRAKEAKCWLKIQIVRRYKSSGGM